MQTRLINKTLLWRTLAVFAWFASGIGVGLADPCRPADDVRRVHVRDFDAAGDGNRDDGPAIRAALKAALDGPKPVAMEFEAGKTYRVTSFDERYALQLLKASDVTLLGNGAELLLAPPNMMIRIEDSSDIAVCGLTVDYSPLPFTQGLVVASDPANGSVELEIEPGFEVPAPDKAPAENRSDVWRFAKPYDASGEFDRRVHIRTVQPSEGSRRIRVVFNNANDARRLLPQQSRLVMVTPDMGHTGSAVVRISSSARVHLGSMKLHAVPKLSFYIADNHGEISFSDVEQRIRPGSGRVMTGWRGVFHVKDNRAPVRWDGCHVEGAFDDAFNISAMFQIVEENAGPNTWRLRDPSADEAPVYKAGDRLQAIDITPARKLLGEAKIVSLEENGKKETVVTLSDALPLKATKGVCTGRGLCGSRVVNLDAANAGSSIRRCTIHGGVRLRRNVVLEESVVDGVLRIVADPTRVGPLPGNVTVKDSRLSGIIRIGADRESGGVMRARRERGGGTNEPEFSGNWDSGERWARDIVLQGNRIDARLKADGASLRLIDNDIARLAPKNFWVSNSAVQIRNLTSDGNAVTNPASRMRIGNGMTQRDIAVER